MQIVSLSASDIKVVSEFYLREACLHTRKLKGSTVYSVFISIKWFVFSSFCIGLRSLEKIMDVVATCLSKG